MVKCDTILDKDLVVVNLTDKENPIITKSGSKRYNFFYRLFNKKT